MNKLVRFGVGLFIVALLVISMLPTAAIVTRALEVEDNPYAPELSQSCDGDQPVLTISMTQAPADAWVEVVGNRSDDSLKFTLNEGKDFGYNMAADPGGYKVTVRESLNPQQDLMPEDGRVLSVQFETVEVCGSGS